jgi:hypothetical protein
MATVADGHPIDPFKRSEKTAEFENQHITDSLFIRAA